MNAHEARQAALNVFNGKNEGQLKKVNEAIQKAINNGDFKAYYYESLLPAVENHLKTEGYQVKSSFAMNETTVTISW